MGCSCHFWTIRGYARQYRGKGWLELERPSRGRKTAYSLGDNMNRLWRQFNDHPLNDYRGPDHPGRLAVDSGMAIAGAGTWD
jgi:hypothetical protein